ncbi:MAG: hypothetical protein FJ125_08020 [Deltaproteobacteria bacterium]|nr:hypothetical protein [Deltaproteobacteria bacterium]
MSCFPDGGSSIGDYWSLIIFFGVLLLDYLIWFHLWPLAVKLFNSRKPQRPIGTEREAAIAVYGFLVTFFAIGIFTLLFWLLGLMR